MKCKSTAGLTLLCCFLPMLALGQGVAPQKPAEQIIREDMQTAQEALRANQPAQAGKLYEEVLRLDPNNADARGNLGVVAMSTGDWTKAAENLEAALKLQPSQDKVKALLGISL